MKTIILSVIAFLYAMTSMAQVINSREAIAPAVSDLIANYYEKYALEQLQNVKGRSEEAKAKKQEQVKSQLQLNDTDYKKLSKLTSKERAEIYQFIVTSVSGVGTRIPEPEGRILFYLSENNQINLTNECVLYLFLNGQCYGVGTSVKGLYTLIDTDEVGEHSIHEVVVVSHVQSTGEFKEVFNSSVMFKLKKEYNYHAILKRGKIEELILR